MPAAAAGACGVLVATLVGVGLHPTRSSDGVPESLPVVTVDEPVTGAAFTEGSSFIVRGRVSTNEPCELLVDATAVRAIDGRFTAALRATARAGAVSVRGRWRGRVLEPVTRAIQVRDPRVPEWFWRLAEGGRPQLPLPDGFAFGKDAGQYLCERDRSTFVYVSPGTFRMGSSEPGAPAEERPVHEVRLGGFFFARVPVTNRQFDAFVRATGYVTGPERARADKSELAGLKESWTGKPLGGTWRDPRREGTPPPDDLPVTCVTWADAAAYAEWARLELPTEAQWERAAAWDPVARRSGRYAWGDAEPDPRSNPFRSESPSAVAAFPAGVSPSGALDVTGHVCQWCRDGSAEGRPPPYDTETATDPCTGSARSPFHMNRGERSTIRFAVAQDGYFPHVGFRCALTTSEAARAR